MSDAHGSHDPGPSVDHGAAFAMHQMTHDQHHREFMASDPSYSRPWDGNRTLGLGYALWLFLGWAGGHRVYVGRWKSALAMAAVGFFTWIMTTFLGPYLGLPMTIWWIVDAFLIPGWIRTKNEENAARKAAEASLPDETV
jgi:TM2 domain-containing membrane protein YozV